MKTSTILVCTLAAVSAMFLVQGCNGDDPISANPPERITDVELGIFEHGNPTSMLVTATDPDGDGPARITATGFITLKPGTTYTLRIGLHNRFAMPGSEDECGEDEIMEEGDAHMAFFSWTNNLFGNPLGTGNIANRSGKVNYTPVYGATDSNGLPLGIYTEWTTATSLVSGQLRILLKHQPGLKTATSGSDVGATDLDVTVDVHVQ